SHRGHRQKRNSIPTSISQEGVPVVLKQVWQASEHGPTATQPRVMIYLASATIPGGPPVAMLPLPPSMDSIKATNGRFLCVSFLVDPAVPQVFRPPALCWPRRPPAIFPLYLQDSPDGLPALAALSLTSHVRELHLRELYLTPARHRADPV